MLEQELLSKPGEHALTLTIAKRNVEAVLTVPKEPSLGRMALLAHPHPLHGGAMNNKVVTTVARTLRDLHIPSLRFNFRGVGKSEGNFDKGAGESDDVVALAELLAKAFQSPELILSGFSFGAYVTFRAANRIQPAQLISIAPAVNHGNFHAQTVTDIPWHIIAAGSDEIVPLADVKAFYDSLKVKPELTIMEGCSHFFHGRLVDLKQQLIAIINEPI